MAVIQTPRSTSLESLSEHERFLAKATDDALRDGIQLERWARDPNRNIKKFALLLYRPFKEPFTLANKAWGYFGDVKIGNQTLPAVGLYQDIQFSSIAPPNPEERLHDFVFREFMPRSHWKYDDGRDGGFTIKPMLYRTTKGEYGVTPPTANQGVVDWRELGTVYDWQLITIRLYDFVVGIGPWIKQLDEAVAVVLQKDFIHIMENPRPGHKLEIAIAYPFIAFAPIPNFFGFGPGKFDWAVKLFSFILTDKKEIIMTMDFVAGRRPAKVLDFGKFVPDPIYGTAELVHLMTLGLLNKQKVHDTVDGEMMRMHGRVHQSLADGAAKIWEDWVRQGCPKS